MKQFLAISAFGILCSCSETKDQPKQVLSDISTNIEKAEITPINRVSESASSHKQVESDIIDESKIQTDIPEEPSFKAGKEKPGEEIVITNFHEYEAFNSFLKKHVSSSGKVNYNSAKVNMTDLDNIINEFQRNLPEPVWTKNQKLAYWINAYNLFTIKYVASNYPIASIKDITAKPWDNVFIELGGRKLSLNDIEHKEIRAKYNEPRIHFALNCASESCPILLNRAYLATSLDYQLTLSTKKFLKDKTKNDLTDPKAVKISQLFDWYKTDFDKGGDVISFINKYLDSPLDNPTISYLDYSWKLNN